MQPSCIRSMIRVPRYARIGMSVNWVWDTESKKNRTTHNLNVQCSESWWRGESDVNEKSGARLLYKCLIGTSHWHSSIIFAHISHPTIDASTFFSPTLSLSLCACFFLSVTHCLFNFLHPVSCTHWIQLPMFGHMCTWIFALFSSCNFPHSDYDITYASPPPPLDFSVGFHFSANVCVQSRCIGLDVCLKPSEKSFFLFFSVCTKQRKINLLDCIMYLTLPLKNFTFFPFRSGFFWVRLWKFPLSRVLWHSLSRHIKMRCTIQCNYIQAFCIIFLLFHFCVSVYYAASRFFFSSLLHCFCISLYRFKWRIHLRFAYGKNTIFFITNLESDDIFKFSFWWTWIIQSHSNRGILYTEFSTKMEYIRNRQRWYVYVMLIWIFRNKTTTNYQRDSALEVFSVNYLVLDTLELICGARLTSQTCYYGLWMTWSTHVITFTYLFLSPSLTLSPVFSL